MSKSNVGFSVPFAFFVVLVSLFSPKSAVLGSVVEERRFKRPDPLAHFKFYSGGYDISSKHYWASAAFTGVHSYAIAGVWVLCGFGFGVFLCAKNPTNSTATVSDTPDHYYYFLMFFLVILFTFLAIVASGFVIATNESAFKRTKKLKATVLKAGINASRTTGSVIKVITEMQNLLLPYDPITSRILNITAHRLRKESRTIQISFQKHGRSIDLAIQTSYIAHLVIVTVNLASLVSALASLLPIGSGTGIYALVSLVNSNKYITTSKLLRLMDCCFGSVLLLLHWHPGFISIIFLCWILTTLCWVLTAFDFFYHTLAEDTCSALQDYEQNPHNNSLSFLLPCLDSSYSDKVLGYIGYTVHNFITELNSKMIEVYKLLGLNDESKDLLGLWEICDPFSAALNYSYTPEICRKDAVSIGDLPSILARFTCFEKNMTETCRRNGKFLPGVSYKMAWAYSRSIQDLLDIFPALRSLSECSFVKDSFSDVVLHQCRPFRVSIRLLWTSMLCLSIFMVVLVLIWVAKAFQDRGRCFSRCAIVPRPY